jgi:hypothetical protein
MIFSGGILSEKNVVGERGGDKFLPHSATGRFSRTDQKFYEKMKNGIKR